MLEDLHQSSESYQYMIKIWRYHLLTHQKLCQKCHVHHLIGCLQIHVIIPTNCHPLSIGEEMNVTWN